MRRSYSSCPVASRKFRNSSADSRTSVSSSRSSNWRRKAPAATGVVSVHSAGRASTRSGFRPARAAWSAVAAPITPPPMMTSSADAGGDADQPGMADQPDDLALAVGLGHQAGDLLVPTELVRSPPAGHHDRVEVVGGHVLRRDGAGRLECVLSPDRLAACGPDHRDVRSFLAEAHERHPELEVLEPLRQEHRDLAARQARSVRHDGLTSAIRDYRSGASGWPPPLRTEPLRSSREGPGWASPHRWLSTRGRSIPSPPRPGGVWPCSPPLRARTPGPGARRTRTSRPPGSPGPARTWKRSARGIRPVSRTGTGSQSYPGRPGTAGPPARPDAASS